VTALHFLTVFKSWVLPQVRAIDILIFLREPPTIEVQYAASTTSIIVLSLDKRPAQAAARELFDLVNVRIELTLFPMP
jgi:hypothetical protein